MRHHIYIIICALMCGALQAKPIDNARKDAKVDAVHKGEGLPSAFTGEGVVVGIIDAGIDYSHPAFRTSDGTLRIKKVWEQGATSSTIGHIPSQGYGLEFTTAEEILKARGDTKAGSHGTHVTAIATGSRNTHSGNYHGVAPDADIVIVATPTDDAEDKDNKTVIDAIDYIFAYADEVGKPCVINISIGSHQGPHDGTSLLDRHIDEVVGPGRIIVGAAGNYGAEKFHLQKIFGSEGETVQTLIDFKKAPSKTSTGGFVDIWGEAGMDYTVSLIAYNTFNHNVTEELVITTDTEGEKEYSFRRDITGPLKVTTEISPVNGKLHILIKSGITGIRTNNQCGIRVTSKTAGQVDMWSDHSKMDLRAMGEEGFSEPTNEATITEIGGTAKRIISVGAYCTRERYTAMGTSESVPSGDKLGGLCSFSGFGPTADGRQKPEICTPGGIIISALSSNDESGTQKKAIEFTYGTEHYSYGYMQGTSMSAPFMTGTVALCLEACPDITPEQIKSILSSTSVTVGDETHWGWGKLDAQMTVRMAVEQSEAGIENVNVNENVNVIYDLQGRRLTSKPQHGIYIDSSRKKKVASPLTPLL